MKLSAPHFSRELAAAYADKSGRRNAALYPRLLTAIRDGRVPAERIEGRYFLASSDKALVAEILGMVSRAELGAV